MTVAIRRSTTTTSTVIDEIKFVTEEVADPALEKGSRMEVTAGVNGRSATTYLVTQVDGREISRVAVASVVESEERDAVVRVGTMTLPDPSTKVLSANEARALAKSMIAKRGWDQGQFSCLVQLWNRESNWLTTATNPYSGAYGIAQSLPPGKYASAGNDWLTNYRTQIEWGLGYIKNRYGSPCGAWAHSEAVGWY